jgi:hypothetical protein
LADNASISGVGNLQVFTGIQQATGDVMAPFSGGFVWSDAATTVRINPLTSKTGGRIGSSGGRVSNDDIDAAAWMIPLSLSSNIEVDVLGGIGMHPEASLSKDKFDEMGVPRFMVYNDLYTRHEDYFYPKFATDIVPTGASHTWSFTLSSNKNQELTELVWDNEVLNDRLSKLYLLDLSRGVVIDMNAQNSYAVNLSHGDFKFEIQFVTDGEAFLPHHLIMGNAFPNPAISMVTIPVIIPQEAGDHYMTLKVYDMNGKEITTLAEGVFAPGGHMFNWNIGQQEKNDINGLYFYRLTFDNDQFTPIQKKIIIQR